MPTNKKNKKVQFLFYCTDGIKYFILCLSNYDSLNANRITASILNYF